MKLDKEVFSQPEFAEYANANLVLLKSTFRQETASQRPERSQHRIAGSLWRPGLSDNHTDQLKRQSAEERR